MKPFCMHALLCVCVCVRVCMCVWMRVRVCARAWLTAVCKFGRFLTNIFLKHTGAWQDHRIVHHDSPNAGMWYEATLLTHIRLTTRFLGKV